MNEVPTVRRVVLTSSVSTLGHTPFGKPPGYSYTDADWNTESSLTDQPYSYSKTQVWPTRRVPRKWRTSSAPPGPLRVARYRGHRGRLSGQAWGQGGWQSRVKARCALRLLPGVLLAVPVLCSAGGAQGLGDCRAAEALGPGACARAWPREQ